MGLLSRYRPVRKWTIGLGCCVEAALQTRNTGWSSSTAMVQRVAVALSADTSER